MKRIILLSISIIILISFFYTGLPFTLNAGKMNWVGSKLQFVTSSRSLASLIGMSNSASIQCFEQNICVAPMNRSGFEANMPITFELCEPNIQMKPEQCRNASLKISLNTVKLLKAGLKR